MKFTFASAREKGAQMPTLKLSARRTENSDEPPFCVCAPYSGRGWPLSRGGKSRPESCGASDTCRSSCYRCVIKDRHRRPRGHSEGVSSLWGFVFECENTGSAVLICATMVPRNLARNYTCVHYFCPAPGWSQSPSIHSFNAKKEIAATSEGQPQWSRGFKASEAMIFSVRQRKSQFFNGADVAAINKFYDSKLKASNKITVK